MQIFKRTTQYTTFLLLGCGIILFHDLDLANRFYNHSFKIHRAFGKTFGLSLFTFAV